MVLNQPLEKLHCFGNVFPFFPVERRQLKIIKHTRIVSVDLNHKQLKLLRKRVKSMNHRVRNRMIVDFTVWQYLAPAA